MTAANLPENALPGANFDAAKPMVNVTDFLKEHEI